MTDTKTEDDEAKTERFNMFMSPSEMKAIDEWAWSNRIRSKSEAVRRLLKIALLYEDHQKKFIEVLQVEFQVAKRMQDLLAKHFEKLDTKSETFEADELDLMRAFADSIFSTNQLALAASAITRPSNVLRGSGDTPEDVFRSAEETSETIRSLIAKWDEKDRETRY